MGVKIKVSYERPEELQGILEKLAPDVKTWKVSGKQTGRFKKAYVAMKECRIEK